MQFNESWQLSLLKSQFNTSEHSTQNTKIPPYYSPPYIIPIPNNNKSKKDIRGFKVNYCNILSNSHFLICGSPQMTMHNLSTETYSIIGNHSLEYYYFKEISKEQILVLFQDKRKGNNGVHKINYITNIIESSQCLYNECEEQMILIQIEINSENNNIFIWGNNELFICDLNGLQIKKRLHLTNPQNKRNNALFNNVFQLYDNKLIFTARGDVIDINTGKQTELIKKKFYDGEELSALTNNIYISNSSKKNKLCVIYPDKLISEDLVFKNQEPQHVTIGIKPMQFLFITNNESKEYFINVFDLNTKTVIITTKAEDDYFGASISFNNKYIFFSNVGIYFIEYDSLINKDNSNNNTLFIPNEQLLNIKELNNGDVISISQICKTKNKLIKNFKTGNILSELNLTNESNSNNTQNNLFILPQNGNIIEIKNDFSFNFISSNDGNIIHTTYLPKPENYGNYFPQNYTGERKQHPLPKGKYQRHTLIFYMLNIDNETICFGNHLRIYTYNIKTHQWYDDIINYTCINNSIPIKINNNKFAFISTSQSTIDINIKQLPSNSLIKSYSITKQSKQMYADFKYIAAFFDELELFVVGNCPTVQIYNYSGEFICDVIKTKTYGVNIIKISDTVVFIQETGNMDKHYQEKAVMYDMKLMKVVNECNCVLNGNNIEIVNGNVVDICDYYCNVIEP